MNQEELNQLREKFVHLIDGSNTQSKRDMIAILSECLFKFINEHGKEPAADKREAEAKIVLQMMFSKLLSLRTMLDGVSFQSREGFKLNNIIDPVVVAGLVRTMYETLAMFNIVYTIPQTPEEMDVLYKMWVVAGLKYRQKFAPHVTTPENIKKQTDEAAKIQAFEEDIKNSNLFNGLTVAGANTVKDQLKKKDYKVHFNNNTATALSWDGIMSAMNMSKDKMGAMYTYFSLYAHPSNVAVFQYGDLFSKEDEAFIWMSNFNAEAGIRLVSFFIASYIKLFPNTLKIFEALPIIEQCAINFYYKSITADQSTINNSLGILG